MKKSLSKALKITIPLALGFFLVFYVYNKFTEEQIKEIKVFFVGANYWYLALSLCFAFLSHFSRAYRWHYMLESMGYEPRTANNLMAVFIGYLMNMGVPRSGEISRAVVLKKYENVPFQKAMGSIVAERMVDFVVLNLFVLFAVISQFGRLKNFILEHIPVATLLKYLILFIILGGGVLLFLKKSKLNFVIKLKDLLHGFKDGLMSIFRMKYKFAFFLHTFFIWIMYVLMYYVAIFALKETSSISFSAVLSSFVVGALAITFTNGGFGAYPFLISEVLMLYDVPETAGTAFGWIVWASQFAFLMFFGGLCFIVLPIYNRKRLKN